MSYTAELMDAAKRAQGITSDYRLAQVLGVTRATVSNWRVRRKFPNHTTTCELARLAGIEAGAALLGVGVERLGAPENRPRLVALREAFAADPARTE